MLIFRPFGIFPFWHFDSSRVLDKENQIKQMREELAHQEDLIAKLQREKKAVGENKLKDEETIQSMEDKSNHLNKLKLRLEKQLDEVEDSWEREKTFYPGYNLDY